RGRRALALPEPIRLGTTEHRVCADVVVGNVEGHAPSFAPATGRRHVAAVLRLHAWLADRMLTGWQLRSIPIATPTATTRACSPHTNGAPLRIRRRTSCRSCA